MAFSSKIHSHVRICKKYVGGAEKDRAGGIGSPLGVGWGSRGLACERHDERYSFVDWIYRA